MGVKISVIIPIYNKEKYLEECIQSVLAQSIKSLEVICVDDGSTDRSIEILERMKGSDGRIRILKQRNMGAGAARNKGLEEAEGEFVHFMDADDYYMNEMSLERLYQAGIEQDVQIVGGLFYTEQYGDIEPKNIYGKLADEVKEGTKVFYKDYQYDYYQYNYIFQRDLLIENHIGFPNYCVFEDPPFLVQAMTAAEVFYIQPSPFYCYRLSHPKYVRSEKQIEDLLNGLNDNLIYSAGHGLKALHRLTYCRLNEEYLHDILWCMKDGDIKILDLLIRLNASVNWDWIEEKEALKKCIIKPLYFVMDSIRAEVMSKSVTNRMFVFPFDRIEQGCRIALYGAGVMGREYHEQLLLSDRYELVLWVDKNAGRIRESFYEIRGIESLNTVLWDYVIIAISDIVAALDVRDTLLNMGIPKEKIVWSLNLNGYSII